MAEREEILRVEVDYDAAGKSLTELEKQLQAVKKQQREWNKTLKEGGELSEAEQKQYAENIKELDKLKQKQKQTTNEVVTGIKKQRGSLTDLRKDLKRLVDQRNKISLDTKEGREAVIQLNDEIKDLNDSISEVEQGGGDFRRNVGNYASALDGFGVNVSGAIGALEGLNLAAIGTKVALLSIPFVAVAAVVALIISKLAESEKFTRALSTGFALLKDAAKPALDLINEGVEFIIISFEKAINFAGEFLGVFKDVSKQQEEGNIAAITSFAQLEKAQQRLIDRERELLSENKKKIRQEEELKNIRDDDRKSITERIKANEELGRVEQERLEAIVGLEQDKLAAIEKGIQLNGEAGASTDQLQKLAEQRLAVEDAIEESVGRQNEQIVNQVTLQRELLEIRSRIAEETAKADLAEAKTDKERFEARRKLLEIELKNQEEAIKQEGLNAEQRAALLLAAERQYLVQQQELREEFGLESLPSALVGTEEERDKALEDLEKFTTDTNKIVEDNLNKNINAFNKETKAKDKESKAQLSIDKAQADQEASLLTGTLGLAKLAAGEGNKAQVVFGLAEVAINLAKGLSASSAAFAAQTLLNPTPAGLALASAQKAATDTQLGITAALSGATIAGNAIAAAAGGGDFVTNGPTMLLVGDNPGGQERVTVDPIGARGTTRTAGTNLSQIRGNREADTNREQAQVIASALQAMPPPVLVVKDYQKAEKRVAVKQSIAGL